MLSSENVKLVRCCYNLYHVQFVMLIRFSTDFERFTPYIGELRKKQHVTAQSLEKIEDGTFDTLALEALLTVPRINPFPHTSCICNRSQEL